MAIWRVNNSIALGGEACAPWQPDHAYQLGARCVCRYAYATVARRGLVFECTTAGKSAATGSEPAWPTSGTRTDGPDTLVWTVRTPNDGVWDNASCYLFYVLNHSSIAAGDTVYIDDSHHESILFGAAVGYLLKGSATKNNPIRILSVDKATDAISVGAIIEDLQTSVVYPFVINGSGYSYGVYYKSGTCIRITTNYTCWYFETSTNNRIFSVASGRYIGAGSGIPAEVTMKGDIELAGSTSYFAPVAIFNWIGGTLIAPSGVAILMQGISGTSLAVVLKNVDISAMGNNTILDTGGYSTILTLSRCKLPAAYTAVSAVALSGYNTGILRLHHCSSGNRSYDFYEQTYCGITQDETTIVRTGGASDGTTTISMKMVSTVNTKEFFGNYYISPPITVWTPSTTEKTFTIELVHDSATALQDDEIWMELEYPADNTSGLGVAASSKCVSLVAPADIPDSAETWTTTGMANPNTRKLSVTVTPGKAGPITARVYLAKASTTVYVDPVITES